MERIIRSYQRYENHTNLESFYLFGLFGQYDVKLILNDGVNIYIGENGLGKTTILNCLYFALNRSFSKLADMPFSGLQIKFRNSQTVHTISKADVLAHSKRYTDPRDYYIDEEYLQEILNDYNLHVADIANLTDERFSMLAERVSIVQEISLNAAKRRLFRAYEASRRLQSNGGELGNAKNVSKVIKALNDHISERIIYLPTYRRIENDFSNLRIPRAEDQSNSELLIRFGMSDVQRSIDDLLSKIRKLAMSGYNKMTQVLLTQYTDVDIAYDFSDIPIDREVTKIVLNRLGDEIDEEHKNKILRLIDTNCIYGQEYIHLKNLLLKLNESYELQKHYDTRIIEFAETCNKYLINKHFNYDPSNLTLDIYLNDATEGRETVQLTQLSSGEKQIVSLFSKLYLESEKPCIVIIDEPELSLSLSWQQRLIPDIMHTDNCNLLLTVTHSPFIFENEFDNNAKEIWRCMSRTGD